MKKSSQSIFIFVLAGLRATSPPKYAWLYKHFLLIKINTYFYNISPPTKIEVDQVYFLFCYSINNIYIKITLIYQKNLDQAILLYTKYAKRIKTNLYLGVIRTLISKYQKFMTPLSWRDSNTHCRTPKILDLPISPQDICVLFLELKQHTLILNRPSD